MTRRFKKNPEVPIVIVPGHGRVHDVDVLEGDEYARYAPFLLREIDASAAASPTQPEAPPEPPQAPAVNSLLQAAVQRAAEDTVPVPAEPSPPSPPPSADHQEAPAGTEEPDSETAEAPVATMVDEAPAAETAPVKRKPGRPRKVQPTT